MFSLAKGCFCQRVLSTHFPSGGVHVGHGLKETRQIPPQVPLTGLRLPKKKAQNPKITLEQKHPLPSGPKLSNALLNHKKAEKLHLHLHSGIVSE